MLDREEYVEQAYFFRTLRERMQQDMSTQELLVTIRHEILATTNLPHALDFMSGELQLTGGFATAMARLPHYFTPFQTFVVAEAEKAEGRFDFRIALPSVRGHEVDELYYDIHVWMVDGGEQSDPTIVRVYRD